MQLLPALNILVLRHFCGSKGPDGEQWRLAAVGVENANLRNLGERLSAKLNPSNSRFCVVSIKPPPTPPSPKPRHPNQPSSGQHCPQCSPDPSAALLSRPGESSLRPSSCHSMRASPPSLAPQNHPQFPNHWSTQKQILQQQQKTPN